MNSGEFLDKDRTPRAHGSGYIFVCAGETKRINMYKYCIVPRSGVKFWLLSVSGLSGGIAGVGGCEVAQVVAAIIAGSLADGFITSPPASSLL